MKYTLPFIAALSAVSLGGCATLPRGPSVMVLPGSNKSFEQFQADNAVCREYARQQIGLTPNQLSQQNTIVGAGVGAALGAALGAAAGGGRGAAIGAAGGAVAGTAVGAGNAAGIAYDAQQRYDFAYEQCMYAKGNRIPVAGEPSAGASGNYPPPPSGQQGGVQPLPPPGPGQSYPPPNTPPPPGVTP